VGNFGEQPWGDPTSAISVYFASPGSPWQRGSNENMNGLLRQYFPRSMDLRSATIDDLRRVEELL
jgi:IS30 family transposase